MRAGWPAWGFPLPGAGPGGAGSEWCRGYLHDLDELQEQPLPVLCLFLKHDYRPDPVPTKERTVAEPISSFRLLGGPVQGDADTSSSWPRAYAGHAPTPATRPRLLSAHAGHAPHASHAPMPATRPRLLSAHTGHAPMPAMRPHGHVPHAGHVPRACEAPSVALVSVLGELMSSPTGKRPQRHLVASGCPPLGWGPVQVHGSFGGSKKSFPTEC